MEVLTKVFKDGQSRGAPLLISLVTPGSSKNRKEGNRREKKGKEVVDAIQTEALKGSIAAATLI
jgi:hypothetical protein